MNTEEDIYENAILCEEDSEYKIYCDVCNAFCIVR